MKRYLVIVFCVSLLSCGHPQVARRNDKITFYDGLGRKIELSQHPQKVISFAPNLTEIIYALDAEDKLMAVTAWCNYPPQARQKEVVGDYQSPNWERILSLRPDLVLLVATEESPILSRLKAHRIPTAAFRSETPQDIIKEISLLGALLGKQRGADSLSRCLMAQHDSLRRAVAAFSTSRPLVFVEISDRPLYTGNDHSFLGQLITMAGGRNLAADMSETYAAFSPELVIARKPDIILILHPGTDPRKVAQRPGWANIPAVKNGRVYCGFDLDLMMRPGPRFVQAAEVLYRIFHEN